MKLDKISEQRLQGVHPDLVKVVRLCAQHTGLPFRVTEGLRTVQRQRQLYAAGASKTMRSRHLTGHAVDLVAMPGGKVSWAWPLYDRLANEMEQAARDLKIPVEWGGSWTRFRDGVHWQLPWKDYPA